MYSRGGLSSGQRSTIRQVVDEGVRRVISVSDSRDITVATIRALEAASGVKGAVRDEGNECLLDEWVAALVVDPAVFGLFEVACVRIHQPFAEREVAHVAGLVDHFCCGECALLRRVEERY